MRRSLRRCATRNAESDRRQAEWDTVQKGNEEAAALRQWQAPDGLRTEKELQKMHDRPAKSERAYGRLLEQLAGSQTAQKPAVSEAVRKKEHEPSARDNTIPELRGGVARATSFFRERKDEIGFLSILFEAKNETDSTSAKHKNEDFLKEPENVRKSLSSSERQLRPANDKAEEPTIKKTNQECAVFPRPVGGNGRGHRK